ncbi:fimbrial protein [Kluyvera sichuanensis]|uniref:fimbrial protein n=1 Tax=Kluyvera sichuanensis TaxID=2725494 RepID=UPI002FD71E81
MTKYLFILPVIIFAGSVSANVLNPYGGRVLITGNIQDNTCTVSTDSSNLSVSMGTVNSKQLRQSGDTSLPIEFDIDLQNCGEAASGVSVTFTGTADGSGSSLLALDSAGDSATGIGVAILDSDRTLIPINTASKTYPLDPSQADNILPFYAQYSVTGSSVTPGSANATATFSLTYQ